MYTNGTCKSSQLLFVEPPAAAQHPGTAAQQETSDPYDLGPPDVRKRKVSEMDFSDVH